MGKVAEGTVREFSATVNGKRRSVLITMPPGKENDVEEAYLMMCEEETYWGIFWGFDPIELDINPEATAEDFNSNLEDMKLRKVRLS
jgi:hypothetical protein